MNNRWKKTVVSFLMMLLAVLCFSVHTDAAAYGKIDQETTLYAWPISKADLCVFADAELTQESDQVSYRRFEITELTDSYAKVKYKEGKKKIGYVAVEKFIYNTSYNKTGAYVTKSAGMHLYKRPTSAKSERFMLASFRSGGITLGVKGNYVQMMMKKGRHFYLGWVSFPTFRKTIYRSMLHTDQILSNGTYTVNPRNGESVKAAKYKLTYAGEGMYHLKDTKTGQYLEIAGTNNIALKRSGAYFYLYSETEEWALNNSGKEVKAKKTARQQWSFRKEYQIPKKSGAVIYSQYDPEFGSRTYQKGYAGVCTISSDGCGLISLVNAIYALNGEYLEPKELVKFAVSRGHYFYNQGTADTIYPDIARKWGNTYHFRHAGKTTSFAALKKHLQKKGTAVALVPGHYIAIVAYRKSDGKYLVYDSAVSGSRPTSIYGDWKSQGELSSGRLRCEYFHLFSAR